MRILLLVVFCASAYAGEYTVREFSGKAHFERFGPDVMPILQQGGSVFMGAHIKQNARQAREPSVFINIASSLIGNNRYFRLQTKKYSDELELQIYHKAGAGLLKMTVGRVELNRWYAAGVLLEQNQVTVYLQEHGSQQLLQKSASYSADHPALDLYSVARISYVKSTGGQVYSAHNFLGQIAKPVFVTSASQAEISQFMAMADPHGVWSNARFLVSPRMDSAVDLIDSEQWTFIRPSESSLAGTLTLGASAPAPAPVPTPAPTPVIHHKLSGVSSGHKVQIRRMSDGAVVSEFVNGAEGADYQLETLAP